MKCEDLDFNQKTTPKLIEFFVILRIKKKLIICFHPKCRSVRKEEYLNFFTILF